MKKHIPLIIIASVVGLIVVGWILHFHSSLIAPMLPERGRKILAYLAEAPPPAQVDEEPDNSKNQIPVHTAHVTRATLHGYIPDGFGTIAPRPARNGEMAGSASIASPVVGVVSQVLCEIGQKVNKGDPLIQLDDRLAKAAEDQAAAALAQTNAALENLKASRPQQLEIAQLNLDKSHAALDFAQKNYARLQQLASQQGTSSKSVEQAALDLASAQNDLSVNQKQLALLQSSNSGGAFVEDMAKVTSAQAALAAAKTQREMMRIVAPIEGTVIQLNVNPGEGVDPTKTLLQVVAMDRLMVDVDVPAEQLPSLSVGLPVIVVPTTPISATDSSPDQLAPIGKVTTISPDVNPKTGAVQVNIDLAPGPMVRPGMHVRVRIVAAEHKDILVVPREAVVTDDNNASVISVVEGDQATAKTVHVGLIENGMIEIAADGLKEGDTVVTAGAYGLPQATRVKVID
ncbi:MAG: efflux RND transporter periplasmic adaptor subunit [Planctomycetota bacterium]|nr:efflux RND transporter periplasmic adaptor subunit [Planctomycetota bacterium]